MLVLTGLLLRPIFNFFYSCSPSSLGSLRSNPQCNSKRRRSESCHEHEKQKEFQQRPRGMEEQQRLRVDLEAHHQQLPPRPIANVQAQRNDQLSRMRNELEKLRPSGSYLSPKEEKEGLASWTVSQRVLQESRPLHASAKGSSQRPKS